MGTTDDKFEYSTLQPFEGIDGYHSQRVEPAPDRTTLEAHPSELAVVARNRNRLLVVLLLLLGVAAGPLIYGQFVYHGTYNELKAGYDVASGALGELRPRLNDLELASRLVGKRVEPSVVSIYRPAGMGEEGQGSGVIVDHEGYIVTNYHVVKGAPSILVQLKDGRRAVAQSIGEDPETDLAILKIDLPDLMPAEWADSDKLEVGDLVWALGSPFGLESSLTFGIVSAKSRHGGDSLFQEYLQTDAAVNPGNSGGPLVNIEGQICGINSAIVGPSYQGISFAIPSTLAHARYDEIRKNGRVERAWLGVAPAIVPTGIRKQLKLEEKQGVLLEEVEPQSPADRAGFRRGDIILQWNGVNFNDPNVLTQAIASSTVGSTAKVAVVRPGDEGDSEKLELEVPMERRPRFVPRIRRGR